MAASRRPPAHIQLTDFVPEMLDVARERETAGAACGVPIDFEVVDAQEIPYADNSYDAVTMAYGIRNIPDRMKALREVHRVLKPGGTFACLEFSTPPNAVWRFLYHIYLKVMIPFWGQVFTHDRPSFVYLADSIRAFPDQEHYAQMLRDAGFSDVSWTWPKEAKVDLREKPARLSGLCFWWACSTSLILHLQHRKARRWKREQPLHRPSCRQIVRASASPRRCRPGAPHGSTYCERAPCLERAHRGRAR